MLFFYPSQDAGLENMALEVGTVQGGHIAALQDGKDGALGKPTLPQIGGTLAKDAALLPRVWCWSGL